MTHTTKHTQGPWRIEDREIVGGRYVATVRDWSTVGAGSQYADINASLQAEANANAHLIAAAPAMYEALKAIQAWSFGQPWPCREMKQFTDIDAALAQAEGAQHE
jgi:hypothetical protein